MLTFGSLSEEGRSNGIQNDSIQNITGRVGDILCAGVTSANGVFKIGIQNDGSGTTTVSSNKRIWIDFLLSNIARSSSETRSKNRKIRIYKRIA